MKRPDYDLIVLGGGSAGITAAVLASGLGKRAALIDRSRFGGECTWSGCVPSKALIHAAGVAHTINSAERFGISYGRGNKPDNSGVMKGVRTIIQDVYSGETPAYFEESGIKAIENAEARFLDNRTLEVNGEKITAARFLIATGSSPLVPPVTGIRGVQYYTNENIFSLKKIPKSLVIMGGGPIGVELASAFNRLGASVTILEMMPAILYREDRETGDMLQRILLNEGVKIQTDARIVRVSGKRRVSVTYERYGREESITADAFLVAAGRVSNSGGLGLDQAGVEFGPTGIVVNAYMRTSARNIYAAGDVTGSYRFSHMANYQAIVAASNALLPVRKRIDYSHVPWCTFTDPELARSGLTEDEARERFGDSIRVYRNYYSGIDRARTDGATEGMSKIICDRKNRILGIHILGERAGELMHEVHLAKAMGLPLHRLNSVIHAYPGFSDVLKNAGRDAYLEKLRNNFFIKLISTIRGKG